jgi:hypothetical protein
MATIRAITLGQIISVAQNRFAVFGRPGSVALSIGREHRVHADPADPDVEQNRERESSEAPVCGKTTAEREKKVSESS